MTFSDFSLIVAFSFHLLIVTIWCIGGLRDYLKTENKYSHTLLLMNRMNQGTTRCYKKHFSAGRVSVLQLYGATNNNRKTTNGKCVARA